MPMRKIGNRFVAQIRGPADGSLSPPCCIYHVLDIVKLSNGEAVPDDEPLFLFRARDRLALPTLRHFREICIADGCNDYILQLLDEMIAEFERFVAEHPEQMKQPGVTRGR